MTNFNFNFILINVFNWPEPELVHCASGQYFLHICLQTYKKFCQTILILVLWATFSKPLGLRDIKELH